MTTYHEKMLQEKYRLELQAENSAKNMEIRKLYEEIERLSNSRKTELIQNICKNCKDKEIEIRTLNRMIVQQKSSHEKQVRQKYSSSNYSEQEVEKLRRGLEQMQRKYQDLLNNKWTTININESPDSNNNKQVGYENQEFIALREERAYLIEKVENCQNRINVLEESNRVLKEEILAHIHANKTPSSMQRNPQVNIHPQSYFGQPLFINYSPNKFLARFRQRSRSPHRSMNSNHCNCTHLSPLSVLQKNQPSCQCKMSQFYEKDLLAERYNNLQRKIRVLEDENTKMRREFSTDH